MTDYNEKDRRRGEELQRFIEEALGVLLGRAQSHFRSLVRDEEDRKRQQSLASPAVDTPAHLPES